MSVYVNHRYRIKRNAEYDKEMHYVVSELKICQSMAELIVTCAVIGYNNNAYVEFERQASDGVLMQFFSVRNYDLMDLLAYAYKKEQSIVKSDDKYTIFESYANGGFPIFISCLGIDLADKEKNNRVEILKKYYSLSLSNGFRM